MKKIFLLICVSLLTFSCKSAKYNYFFDVGKVLDFNSGKWILNKTQSNSSKFDNKLYYNSLRDFKKIIGDSLFEIDDLRVSKLIAPKIKFNLSDIALSEYRL